MHNQPPKGVDPIRYAVIRWALPEILTGKTFAGQLRDTFSEHAGKDTPQFQEALYGFLRVYWVLLPYLNSLLEKPLPRKHQDIQLIILYGLYECVMGTPPHAYVHQAVQLVPRQKAWAKKLVNAVLRQCSQHSTEWTARFARDQRNALCRLPPSWHTDYAAIWGKNSDTGADAVSVPAMGLCVDPHRIARQAYCDALQAHGIAYRLPDACWNLPYGILLPKPVPVAHLPHWDSGMIGVQNLAAQWMGPLLHSLLNQLFPGKRTRILDACASPGGKSLTIAHYCPRSCVTALEPDTSRFKRLQSNLAHWNMPERIAPILADARTWWNAETASPTASSASLFEAIVVDAPCSASGLWQRHPDVTFKYRQNASESSGISDEILDGVWPALQPGGVLIYCTCSFFPAENDQCVQSFLNRHPDAYMLSFSDHALLKPVLSPLLAPLLTDKRASQTAIGVQFSPSDACDGLYYAVCQKKT